MFNMLLKYPTSSKNKASIRMFPTEACSEQKNKQKNLFFAR